MAWETMKKATQIPRTKELEKELIKSMKKLSPNKSEEMIKLAIQKADTVPLWINNIYQAALHKYEDSDKYEARELGKIDHLSIKRIDKLPIHDWRDLQQIKNDICGSDREAVELYPSEDRVVDYANQFHLWVFPAGYSIPIGFKNGGVDFDTDRKDGTKQREKGGD